MKKLIYLVVMSVVVLTGCSEKVMDEPYVFDYFYFDTAMNINIYYTNKDDFDFEQMNEDIDVILKDLEYTFSTAIADSEISKLNNELEIDASDDLINVATKANEYCELTNGLYDPTSGNLIELWSINNNDYLPTDDQIKDAIKDIDCSKIEIDGNHISIPSGVRLDYGSIAKGYASDKIEEYLTSQGIYSALINLGGNIDTIGVKPTGDEFVIAVQQPDVNNFLNENVMKLNIDDKVVITSGINQRFFMGEDGQIYHHILDATTGYQPTNNLASVTIITDSGIDADALSTVCFLLGVSDGINLINTIDNTEAIFITQDKEIIMTSDNIDYEVIMDDYSVIDKEEYNG